MPLCKSMLLRTSILLLAIAWLINPDTAQAQDNTQTQLSKVIDTINAITTRSAAEKLYLHTDKSSYMQNDTLWLKAYLLTTSYLNASQKSGILYVEIASDSNKVVKRISLPVVAGLAYGQISLDDKEFSQGGYVLRGYTNWMRNSGVIFEKPIYVRKTDANDWLVQYKSAISRQDGDDKMRLQLRLKQLNQSPVGLRELQIRLYDDKRTWWQENVETSINGLLDLELDLADKVNGKTATLSVQDKRKGSDNRILAIPFSTNRPDKMDLQFMPEGGELVAGLQTRVAFKAVHEDGLGVQVSGKVYNSKLQEVGSFESAHKGMGSFMITPQPGESYTAEINLPERGQLSYNLPQVKQSGTTLSIKNDFGVDSCEVIINASSDVKDSGKIFLLFAHARGVPVYGFSFKSGALPKKIRISKSLFPSGVARFTLANQELAALNERIIFIDHSDNLIIQTSLNKPTYARRDSVSLEIKVRDKSGLPVKGSFSIAITDDSQVKTDSLSDYSITNQLLLAADLKGKIEEPGYYEQPARNPNVWQNLDHLLLTQGWTGFNWNDAFKPAKTPAYEAEPEFLIKGTVTNQFNKPVAGAPLTLLSGKPPLFMESLTDPQGRFVFKGIYPADTAIFHIQARNKKQKSLNVGIEVDGFVPPEFSPLQSRILPWYANIDTASFQRVNKRVNLERDYNKFTGNVLKEVLINSKKTVKHSKNLNGAGDADITINVQELEKEGRTSLGDLLERKIDGFGTTVNKEGIRAYVIKHQKVYLIIDGIDVSQFMMDDESYFLRIQQLLKYFDAEEIQGIEIMTTRTLFYGQKFLAPLEKHWEYTFVEVTTRGGVGPFLKKTIGTNVYRPIAFTSAKKFYSPRYSPKSIPNMTDIRSTIYWNSKITTNSEGVANVNFFTADTPGTYSVIIEGSNLDGGLGVARRKILINSPAP